MVFILLVIFAIFFISRKVSKTSMADVFKVRYEKEQKFKAAHESYLKQKEEEDKQAMVLEASYNIYRDRRNGKTTKTVENVEVSAYNEDLIFSAREAIKNKIGEYTYADPLIETQIGYNRPSEFFVTSKDNDKTYKCLYFPVAGVHSIEEVETPAAIINVETKTKNVEEKTKSSTKKFDSVPSESKREANKKILEEVKKKNIAKQWVADNMGYLNSLCSASDSHIKIEENLPDNELWEYIAQFFIDEGEFSNYKVEKDGILLSI